MFELHNGLSSLGTCKLEGNIFALLPILRIFYQLFALFLTAKVEQ